MSTTIRTTSEKQMKQIRRFTKKNKIHSSITQENGVYIITIFGLTSSETEKFIKNFLTSTAKISYFSYRLIINHI